MIDQADFGVGTYLHPRVARALAVPRRQTPSEWSAENRVLTTKMSAEPGKWSNRRAPYLVGIMDATCDPDIAEVDIMKAAQTGVSEALRNVLGYWIAVDPGPVLWVLPNQDSAEEVMEERIAPMVRETPALAAHLSTRKHDVSRSRILLDNMDVHMAHATSPQSLASRPRRYAVLDEIGKYPAFSGREADPVSLAKKRLTTFGHRAKCVKISTPTVRDHDIHAEWEACPIRFHYHVPCPHCGEYQVLIWTQVQWPEGLAGSRSDRGAAIEEQALAWYQCALCKKRIEERQREAMVALGVWADPRYEKIDRDGMRVGERPRSRRVGFHVPAIFSPWVTWSQMAGEYVAAVGDQRKMMDWRNSRLGEPFEVRAAAINSGLFESKIRAGHAAGIVPAWAGTLLATADAQKDGYVFVIRAWGYGFRSRKVDHGTVATLAELRARCLEMAFPWQGHDEMVRPLLLAIDSGGGAEIEGSDLNRTDEVYQFALSDPARIFAVKGYGGIREMGAPLRQTFVTWSLPGEESPQKVALFLVNTGYFKDVLAARMERPAESVDAWELDASTDGEYCRQMASEHKIILRRGANQVARWVPVYRGAANHFWDCEVYQQVAAQLAHVELLPPPDFTPPAPTKRRTGPDARPSTLTLPDGRPFLLSQR